jgi:CRISPR-associated protein Csm3
MTIKLLGRLILSGDIRLLTGTRVGGAQGALSIGGVDLPVIRNPTDGRPYLPGSSLKGKMRSLSEKLTGAPQNWPIRSQEPKVVIHVAQSEEEYNIFWVNPIYGVMGNAGPWMSAPNRLIVRDAPLSSASAAALESAKTDQPYTEVKWEAAIDRVTSAATPRQIERVPAGAVFSPMELVFNLYLPEDVTLFAHMVTGLQLVEDDYIGGHGSRGSGKVKFENLKLVCRSGASYEGVDRPYTNVQLLRADADLGDWVRQHLNLP